jgi:branched-chain amino acid transport system permease protein
VWLADLRALAYGLVIIGFLLFEPEGLAGRWRTIQGYWRTYPYTY